MNESHSAENDAACQSCGIGNRTCFLEGGYCCVACQDEGGMTHLTRVLPSAKPAGGAS
jgi:hypothetical protein